MDKGICCAGNMLVDITYPIERWPLQGELTHITEGIGRSTGGCVCNTVTDLARLDRSLRLVVSGIAGHDPEGEFIMQELAGYKNVDTGMVRRDGRTSFTAVMSNNETKERTFFQCAGANAYYGMDDIDWDRLDVDILHIGYVLLLPALDAKDEEYGTKMARLLCRAQERGIKTSIDVVSEAGERFGSVVVPALKYTDYCIINELEAQATTGIPIRDEGGKLISENLPRALRRLHELGVARWAVIHCPELGCGIDENGDFCSIKSLCLPAGYIKGTVGAGDAFCAGVLCGAEREMKMPEAIKLGICTAAASLREDSASAGVEDAEKVMELYRLYGAE